MAPRCLPRILHRQKTCNCSPAPSITFIDLLSLSKFLDQTLVFNKAEKRFMQIFLAICGGSSEWSQGVCDSLKCKGGCALSCNVQSLCLHTKT